MKKLWTSLAVVMLAGTLCVSFAACGKGSSDIMGEAKSVKGEKVTEEEWNAAVETLEQNEAKITTDYFYALIEDFTLSDEGTGKTLSASMNNTVSGKTVKNGMITYRKTTYETKYTGDYEEIMSLRGASASEIAELIKEGKNAEIEEYEEDEYDTYSSAYTNSFVYTKDENGQWSKRGGWMSGLPSRFVILDYEDYVYDEVQKGYIPADYDEDGNDELVVIKFDGQGRIVAIIETYKWSKREGEEKGSETSAWLITYKAENITLPKVS